MDATSATGTNNQFLVELTDSDNDYEDWLEERRISKAANNEDFDQVSSDASSDSSNEPRSPSTVRAQERNKKHKSRWQQMDQTILQPWREYKSLFGVGGFKRPLEQHDDEPSPQRRRTEAGPSQSPKQSLPSVLVVEEEAAEDSDSETSLIIDLDRYIDGGSDDEDNGTDYSLP
jgi:hypothetical protein